ncbi:unnamed protein product [Rotaria socialis]
MRTEEGMAIVKEDMKKAREYEVNQRKYEIDEVLKLTKAQSAIDVCFLVDCTGSMSAYIDATKTQIRQLTDTIIKLHATKPHLAFVGYRDIDENIEKLDFTDDVNIFKMYLDQVNATGGDDTCEDVFSALEIIPQLSWSNPNRIIIHICDAPCHGKSYHKLQGPDADKYAKGDPKNRELSKLLLDIKRLKITYCTIQLNESTKMMFDEFAFIYGTISEMHVKDPAALMKNICITTSSCILSGIESTMSSFRTSDKTIKPYIMLNEEPYWDDFEAHTVHTIEIMYPNTMNDIFQPLFVGKGSGQIKIAPHPFTKGSLRFAFYGQFSSDGCDLVDVVFKEFISSDPRGNSLQVYQEHLEIQVIAQFLADKFNTELTTTFRTPTYIIYADADIVQQKNDTTKIYQVERRFHQAWQKWSNNSGGVSVAEYSTILQAFSHWTHNITAGRLMVVDLQGVRSEGAYLLTDPAIHCDNILRFKHTRTNLGVKGMGSFFRTHICSEVCSKLKLPVQQFPSGSDEIYQILESIDKLDCETIECEPTMLYKDD